MDSKMQLKLNVGLRSVLIVMAIVLLGINVNNYIATKEINWIITLTAVIILLSSVFFLIYTLRELKKSNKQ